MMNTTAVTQPAEPLFDHVFCDLDGTLLEDSRRHYHCYVDIVAQYGGTCIPFEEYWADKRNKVKRTVLLEKTKFKGSYEQYLTAWNTRIETDEYLQYETLKPDTLEMLAWLKANARQLWLVTMRQSAPQLEKQLQALGIRPYFDVVTKGDPTKKQHKADLVEEHYDANSLVIGDTEADRDLAHALGCRFVAVTSGLRDAKDFAGEPYTIETLTELKTLPLR